MGKKYNELLNVEHIAKVNKARRKIYKNDPALGKSLKELMIIIELIIDHCEPEAE